MKKANNLKIIALSLCMLASAPAWAGLGSLQVNSALGEPFSGSVVVTGDEARAALRDRPAVSGAPLQVRVTAQGKNAVIHLRSNKPVRDPMLSFSLTAGSQGRQYTALLDPPAYRYDSADSGKEKGSGKATGKQRKLDKSAKSKSAARATTALQNGLASENAVVKYHVDNNETLMDVARKVRPQGLSVEQTMHALIVANPHAFRNDNPDFMYRDISLNIPSTSQLHKLSKIKIKTVQKTADTAQNTATQKLGKADADVSKPVNTMASEAGDAAQTKVGEVKADTISASAPVQVSAPAASAASVVKAAPVQPKVNHAEPPVQPVEESMLPAWWPYALAGVAGILLIAALLWQQRKKRHGAEEYEDDYSSDDEDDDVVFNAEPPKPKVEQSVSVPATPAKTAEPTVAATAAATSTAADDDDWSWLNGVASDAQAEADAPAGGKVNQAAAVSPLSNTEAVADKQNEDDTDWLNFNFVEDTPAAPADTVVPTTTELDNNDDLSWLDQIDETEQPEVLTTHESTDIAPQEEVDNTDLEWVVADEPQIKSHQEDVMAGQQSTSAASEVEMLNELANLEWDEDFKLDDEAKQDITPAAEEVFSTLEPAPVSPEDDALSTDIDWEALDISDDDSTDQSASPATDSAPAAKVDMQDVSSMDFTLGDDKSESSATDNVVTATTTTPVSSFATGNGAQDWLEQSAESEPVDQPLTPEQQAVPLQAKLELAKMYLEMDDAVTARQTLRELVDEANGAILAEAQNLLQQLGG